MRDWLNVQTQPPEAKFGRIMLATPHEVGIYVASSITYGTIIESVDNGNVLPMLKRVIFQTVRDTLIQTSIA